MNKDHSVEVEIVGGLGNQLFGLAAGLFLSKKLKTKLILNFSLVGVGGTNHGKSLINFSLDNIETTDASMRRGPSLALLSRLSNKLARHFSIFRKLRKKLTKQYTANELGFEDDFWNLKTSGKIRGYFQTYRYADEVSDEIKKLLVLKNTTTWFKGMIADIEKSSPIAVHMRRGDYLAIENEFGILDVNFYSGIVERILDREANSRPIWIFTDSPELIRAEIIGTVLEKSIIIQPPSDSPPNESLLLISRCSKIIMSNSTFSWWAAYLSDSNTQVFAPSKWFKGRKDPERLIPTRWKTEESVWKTTIKVGNEWN